MWAWAFTSANAAIIVYLKDQLIIVILNVAQAE
jgi:hypothetical protein